MSIRLVWRWRRTEAIRMVQDAKGRLVTPTSDIDEILELRRTHVTIDRAAGLLKTSRTPVDTAIKAGLLKVTMVPGGSGTRVRMVAEKAVTALHDRR